MKRGSEPARRRSSFTVDLVLKLLLLASLDALVLLGVLRMLEQRAWLGLTASVVAAFLLNVIYLRRNFLPAKYLFPATVLLAVFAVYPVIYTMYVSFTNYSAAHNLTREQAVATILANSERRLEGAPTYEAVPLGTDAGDLALLLTGEQGDQFLGTPEGLEPADPSLVEISDTGLVTGYGDYRRLTLGEVQARLEEFRVPTPDGSIRLDTLTRASLVQFTLEFDPEAERMTSVLTGDVYEVVDGTFVNVEDPSDRLSPGWRVVVGFENFTRAFTSSAIRGPFVRVFVWNYAFALLTVLLQFGLGLGIALALHHPRLKLKRIYRSLLVIPFALPSYLTALIWQGLLNRDYGAVNRMLGADINWLNDPWMAKVSILLVTMWLGFPYFFLVSTGALTSIPAELTEAAAVDGAGAWYSFRTVRFPLLMITLAPLLIASFAFNFNNFNAVYLLTSGGPPIQGAQTPAGHTDILITYTYRLAFESGRGAQYAFAAAISMIIFVMIMAISAYSFRFTRALERTR